MNEPTTDPSVFQVFHDGDCPLCNREINLLKRLDRQRRIRFTDIAAPEFDEAHWAKTRAELMGSIHGRLANGNWVSGVEVFRQLYSAVGFQSLVAITRITPIGQLLDWAYEKFAKYRLRLTGRCDTGVCNRPDDVGTKPEKHR